MNMKIIFAMIAAGGVGLAGLPAQPNHPAAAAQMLSTNDFRLTLAGSPLGIAWGFLYGYLGTEAERFMPPLRELGAGFSKVYLFWGQIEPEKGKFDWSAVDAYVNQLQSPEEGLIALFSSSQWATKRNSFLLPPSPAVDPGDYYRFVHAVVKHCRGRVRYWQNDSEPNNPVYWAGSKEEFVGQLKVFYKAVKDADPGAVVVVGGYDGLFGPPGTHPFPNQQAGLDFFDYALKEGRNAFDLFDLRLYGDSYTIVARVEIMRQKMRALGYDKPIICTEYGGPAFFQFVQNRKYFSLLTSWTQSLLRTDANGAPQPDDSGAKLIADLYSKIDSLAPETQMFMLGCSPALDAKYDRIQVRSLVMRNLFAFSAGVQKTLYWQLQDIRTNRDNMMTLMYGKIGLLDCQAGTVRKRYPTADAFQRLAKVMAGVQQVRRIELAGKPSVFLFQLDRGHRGPALVVWERRDEFIGEDAPAVPVEIACAWSKATAVDALGCVLPTKLRDGKLQLSISLTPIYVEP